MKRKTTKIKARLDDAGQKHPNLSRWTIPATAEAYDQMVDQMAREWLKCHANTATEFASVALASIGITRPEDTQ